MQDARSGEKKNKKALVLEGIIGSIKSLKLRGREPTFNTILAEAKSRGIISNHRSLRAYLDSLVQSGLLKVRTERPKQPNVHPRQMYSVTEDGPYVEAGVGALLFHGLNWTVPDPATRKIRTDLEGVARARLYRKKLYGSLEDVVVEGISRKGKASGSRPLIFCAVLLATRNFDHSYLIRRAIQKGVEGPIQELMNEIACLATSPRLQVDDFRTLYAVREWFISARHGAPPSSSDPRWSVLSPDELVDAIGKQLGLK